MCTPKNKWLSQMSVAIIASGLGAVYWFCEVVSLGSHFADEETKCRGTERESAVSLLGVGRPGSRVRPWLLTRYSSTLTVFF